MVDRANLKKMSRRCLARRPRQTMLLSGRTPTPHLRSPRLSQTLQLQANAAKRQQQVGIQPLVPQQEHTGRQQQPLPRRMAGARPLRSGHHPQ